MTMDANKRKTVIMFGVLCVLIVGILVYMVFAGDTREITEPDSMSTIRQELPDGFAEEVPDNKRESYQAKTNISTEEYFEMLAYAEDEDISLVSGSPDKTGHSSAIEDKESAAERIFGPAPADRNRLPDINGSHPSFQERTDMHMPPDERLEYDRKRAEMVKDVLTGADGTGRGVENEETDNVRTTGNQIIDFSKSSEVDGIISSLDDSSIDLHDNASMAGRPFKCMFVKSQKIYDGERIRVRLLEDYVADGISIPANTHLTAICRIGKRLELSVLSIQMNGVIVSLSLEAYDTDGLHGIYCPETLSSKNANQASNDAISAAGSTFGGLVGDIANTIIRTGANLARSATGKISVSVISGYEFFLVKNDKK